MCAKKHKIVDSESCMHKGANVRRSKSNNVGMIIAAIIIVVRFVLEQAGGMPEHFAAISICCGL
jgi:hypothetical protein